MSQALATANQTDQRENYCKLLIWWKSPDEIDDPELLRRIMNLGTWEMWQWAWKHFSKESFIYCLKDAVMGTFPMVLGTIGIFAYRSPLSHQFPEINFYRKTKK